MHQPVGQLAVGGEQQQAAGVDVEAADGDPALALEPRQPVEHGAPPLGVLAGAQLPLGLVVHDHPTRHLLGAAQGHRAVVEEHLVAGLDAVAQGRHLAVDLDPAIGDGGLHLAARAEPGAGQDLLQFFAGVAHESSFSLGVDSVPGAASSSTRPRARSDRRASRSAKLSPVRSDAVPAFSSSALPAVVSGEATPAASPAVSS